MLAANLATTFEATQTQPNLVVNGPVTSTSSHNAPVTSAQGEPVTSSQTDDVPDYILSAPVPTTDDVPAAPAYTTPRVLKPVEFNIPFHNDLELFCLCLAPIIFYILQKKKTYIPKVARKLELRRSDRTRVLRCKNLKGEGSNQSQPMDVDKAP